MKVTGTGAAIALAVVVALGFLFFGQAILTPSTLVSTPAMNNESTSAAQPLPTELTVTDSEAGTGATAEAGDTVTVDYIGQLPDGTIFDASQNRGQPFTFQLGTGMVIRGWDEGLVGMKEGGVRTLVIPPNMGYGAQANGPIPANSTLIFQVKLISVQKGS